MKRKEPYTNEDDKLILWGKHLQMRLRRQQDLAEPIDSINELADKTDITLSSLANIVTGALSLWHTIAPFLMNTLNSLPWISLVITMMNGAFRAIRSFVGKTVDPEHRMSGYIIKIWMAASGIGMFVLGLASMFVAATLAGPLTIASACIDLMNNLITLQKNVIRFFTPRKDDSDKSVSTQEIKRILSKFERVILSAVTVAATVLLFNPLTMPLGAGLLIGVSVYTLVDKHHINPVKLAFNALKNKIQGTKTESIKKDKKTDRVSPQQDTTPSILEELYFSQKNGVAAKPVNEDKTLKERVGRQKTLTHGPSAKLCQEPRKHLDLPLGYFERKNQSMRGPR